MKKEFNILSIQAADKIEKYLKENYLGIPVLKNLLRVEFNLAFSQSFTVWDILRQRGLIVTIREIEAPMQQAE